jgi:hypothetical protein
MKTSAEKPARSSPIRARYAEDAAFEKKRKHGRTKLQLLTREAIDGRTNAAKQFAAIAIGIAQDFGGEARLTTVQRHLVEAFAGAAISVNDLNARLLMGEKIDILEQSQVISTLVRIAARLGVRRAVTDITPPSVQDYLAHVDGQEAAE